ncbi:MAG: hypothetical protein F9K24_21870 [Leptonema illini]|uniref:Immunity MXAN-0049 protein domain-containing protein n=1 Tax=Leptonema illini TaxID=183 RepID=A0A833LWU9_9LEPT|nr:MAG: hypothetical protein F9K24_21870 [Leptonema illini]
MEMKYYDAYLARESGVHLDEDEIWLWGNFVFQSDIEVDRPVRFVLEKKSLTQDFVDVSSAFLVSNKLFEVLSKLTDNYKTYPTVIRKKDGTVIEDYRIFHIRDEIACFNWEKSSYVGKDEVTGTPDYRTIVLDRKVLAEHQDKNIFRMKEIKSAIIINDYAKKMLEKAKITGFIYEELAVE